MWKLGDERTEVCEIFVCPQECRESGLNTEYNREILDLSLDMFFKVEAVPESQSKSV